MSYVQTQITGRFVATIVTLAVVAALPGAAALGLAENDDEQDQYTYYLRVRERHCQLPGGGDHCLGAQAKTELWNETNGVAGVQWEGSNPDDLVMKAHAGPISWVCKGWHCYVPPYFVDTVMPITTPVALPVS